MRSGRRIRSRRDDGQDVPAAPVVYALEGRPRFGGPGAPGTGPWSVYLFDDDVSRAAFVAHWQHDLELRLQ